MVLLIVLVGASACGGDEEEGDSAEVEQAADGETTAAMADDQEPGAAEEADQAADPAPTTTSSTTTTTSPPQRRLGVVLLAPDEANNKLNVRAGPGTQNPVVDEFLPARAEIEATGSVELVDGRLWHEVVTDVTGWAYGYYLTESWSPSEIEEEWDWRGTLESFANALVLGEGLRDSVSWRGLFVIHFDDNLRRWTPDEVAGLQDDDTDLKWSNTGSAANESGATVGTWKEVIGDRFLSDYLDEDVTIEVGGLPLGPNAALPGSAISSAFANFPWVAIHDPGDDEGLGGIDWSTWFVFMEMEQSGPKVVGIQPQTAYP